MEHEAIKGSINYKSNLQQKFLIELGKGLLKPVIAALAWTGMSSPGLAAEQLKVRFGSFEESVTVTELEQFVKTGALSSALKPYAIVLTPGIRQTLSSRLQFKPLADQSLTSQQQALTRNRLLELLATIAQGATPQQIQLALTQAERQTEGLSLMTFLKAFSGKTVVINARAALETVSQLKPDTLDSHSFGLQAENADINGPLHLFLDPAALDLQPCR